jgi:tetratricopeptide (TPR) repeat protein
MRALFGLLVLIQLSFAQVDESVLDVHSERARQAQQRGDFKTAAREWEAIIRLAPNVAEAYSNLGMMYHFGKQYAPAIEAFLRAAKLNPKLVAPHLFLGIDYYLTARSSAAIPRFKTALALSPNEPTALKWLGMSYYERGDFKAALRELRLARQIDPLDSDLLFYQSRAYSKQLFQSYEAIRRLDLKSPFLKVLGDEKALATPQGPEEAAIRTDLQSNRLSEAWELSDKLTSRSPEKPSCWYWFGKSAEALALDFLDRFIAVSPESYRVDQLKAEYALAISDDDSAINEFRHALSRKGDALQLHESLGNIFMSRHEYDHAVPEYEAEIAVNPYALTTLERLGQAYAELHQPAKAAAYLDRALKIDGHSYEALRALGKVDFERGDYPDAARNYSLAAENSAAEPAIFFQLSRTYKALGNSAEAARWLTRFRQALAKQHSSVERGLNQAASEAALPQ